MTRPWIWAAIAGVLALAQVGAAEAAVSSTPVLPQVPKSTPMQILPADTTTAKTLITAGANGTIVKAIECSNTDAAVAYSMQIAKVRSATSYLLTTVTIPISAGSVATVPPVFVFPGMGLPLDSDGNGFMFLESGDTLTIAVTVTVTAAKAINCVATQIDY